MTDHDILNLRTRPVPSGVTAVEGCDCGGSAYVHRTDCAIWDLPAEQRVVAQDAADKRTAEYVAELNRRLHAALGREQS